METLVLSKKLQKDWKQCIVGLRWINDKKRFIIHIEPGMIKYNVMIWKYPAMHFRGSNVYIKNVDFNTYEQALDYVNKWIKKLNRIN